MYAARRWTVLRNRWEFGAETRRPESHVSVPQVEHNNSEIAEGQFFARDTGVACVYMADPQPSWLLPASSFRAVLVWVWVVEWPLGWVASAQGTPGWVGVARGGRIGTQGWSGGALVFKRVYLGN